MEEGATIRISYITKICVLIVVCFNFALMTQIAEEVVTLGASLDQMTWVVGFATD